MQNFDPRSETVTKNVPTKATPAPASTDERMPAMLSCSSAIRGFCFTFATNTDGYYLAWLVNHISTGVPVDLICYSFGARIVTGALHLLGGGALMGRMLPEPVRHRAPMQAVLIAGAVTNCWLAIGHPHDQALAAVEGMLALNNGCDRALKRFGAIDPCSHPQALGYTGATGPLGDNGRKLQQVDLCCAVGKQHYWGNYMYSPSIVARIRPYVGLADR